MGCAGGCPVSDQIPTYEIADPTQLCAAGINAANLPVNLPSPGFSSGCSKRSHLKLLPG